MLLCAGGISCAGSPGTEISIKDMPSVDGLIPGVSTLDEVYEKLGKGYKEDARTSPDRIILYYKWPRRITVSKETGIIEEIFYSHGPSDGPYEREIREKHGRPEETHPQGIAFIELQTRRK